MFSIKGASYICKGACYICTIDVKAGEMNVTLTV